MIPLATWNLVTFTRAGAQTKLRPEKMADPLRWQTPRLVSVCPQGDLFHEDVPDEFIAQVWWVMGQCAGFIPERYRGHTFLILTKRPARMRAWLLKWADLKQRRQWIEALGESFDWMDGPKYWPAIFPNVYLGVTAENQAMADERIPLLLQTPAAVRFVSCEPLLGPVDLTSIEQTVSPGYFGDCLQWYHRPIGNRATPYPTIGWVIAGGESGPGARPLHPDWVRGLRDQCQKSGVPFLFKSWGGWQPVETSKPNTWYDFIDWDGKVGQCCRRADGTWEQDPRGPRPAILSWAQGKSAGRLLDGQTWDQYPDGLEVRMGAAS